MAKDGRSYTSANFALELDGFKCGILQKVEGGNIEAAVVKLARADQLTVMKHLGNVKYNDFKLTCSLAMGKPLQEWIDSSLNMKYLRKSGAVHAGDFNRDIRYSRHFVDALISEVTFPGGEGSAKDAAYLNLSFQAETITNALGSGKLEAAPTNVGQKVYMPSNFEVAIDGVPKDDCKFISKFVALTVK